MRLNILLICITLLFTISCLDDNTSIDYRDIVHPKFVNEDNDPSKFIENYFYTPKFGDTLRINPEISYFDSEELLYEWKIGGNVVSTEKNLEWICDIHEKSAGSFTIFRKSANNGDVYGFTVDLRMPYTIGWAILAEKDGKTRLHFVEEHNYVDIVNGRPTQLKKYVEYLDVYRKLHGEDIIGNPTKTLEYWSCESSALGEILCIDENPENCFNMDGQSLFKTASLKQEFINEDLPINMEVADALYMGTVSYIVSKDGKLYSRKNDAAYYTGRYSTVPVNFEGEELNISHVVNSKLSLGQALIFDSVNRRFLLVDADYPGGNEAGTIIKLEGVDYSAVEGFSDLNNMEKEIVCCNHINITFAYEESGYLNILKDSDNKYFVQEFEVVLDYYKNITVTPKYEVEFTGNSLINEETVFGVADKYPAIYFSGGTNNNVLYYYDRTNINFTPTEFKSFNSKIISIDFNYQLSSTKHMAVGLENGDFFIFDIKSKPNLPQEIFKNDINFGKIIDVNFKYGKAPGTIYY